MVVKKLTYNVFWVVLLLSISSFSNDEVLNDVNKFYQNYYKKIADTPNDRTIFYEFRVKVINKDGNENLSASNTNSIYQKGDRMYLKSQYAEVWKSEYETFIISHVDKTIHWINTARKDKNVANQNSIGNFQKVIDFQKQLFDDRQEKKQIELPNGKVQISITPSVEMIEKMFINKVYFLFNPNSKRVESTLIEYSNQHTYQSQEVTYVRENFNSNSHILDGNIAKKVISAGQKPVAKYQGYQIIKLQDEEN